MRIRSMLGCIGLCMVNMLTVSSVGGGEDLRYLTPLSTLFHFSYIVVVSFFGCGNLEKTTDLSQVTDKLYNIMCIEYTSP